MDFGAVLSRHLVSIPFHKFISNMAVCGRFLRKCWWNFNVPITYKRLLWLSERKRELSHSSHNVIQELRERKVVKEIFPDEFDKLPEIFSSGVQCAYAGFDPTADSLHLGNLAVIMGLMHWTRGGHKAIALIGGATAQIGDPSGRTMEREAAIEDVIHKNGQKMHSDLEHLFNNYSIYFGAETPIEPIRILNNMSWYKDYGLMKFLSTVGKKFKLGEMLSRTSVQSRLNSPGGISFCEFSYQVFQTYDWLQLLEKYNCRFQFGGMDQTGNIHAGRDVINRVKKEPVYGLMLPLLLTGGGDKFGKTAGNALWLDSNKTSPFEFYQYFLRIPDKDVEPYVRIFLFDSAADIEQLMNNHMEDTGKLLPQKRLADQVTLVVHGRSGLESAKICTNALFHSTPESLAKLSSEELGIVFKNSNSMQLQFQNNLKVIDLLVQTNCYPNLNTASGFSRAEDIIKNGGFCINGVKVTDPRALLVKDNHVLSNGITVLKVGKRNHYLVRWL